MDIHRCRFVPYSPAAINALAFSHTSSLGREQSPQTLRLAIGRANGDIEIWNPWKGVWFQESVLRGARDRSIEGLVWTHDPPEERTEGEKIAGRLRLFSIGYSSAVTEWDVATGKPIRHSTGNYGEIWCIAAQPREDQKGLREHEVLSNGPAARHQEIAVGCADGSIVLLSTAEEDLQYKRTLARPSKKKARVMSITFQTPNILIAGHADSNIRVYDIRSNQLVRSMSLGTGPVGGPKEVIVWSVKCIADGTIVSGDSTGTVRFWDGNTYTLLQRMQSHLADILDLAVSADGNCVFSGGMDRRTTLYRRDGRTGKEDLRRWKEIAHHRVHKHDVKAMASYESKDLSILASGGLDTTPIITPIRAYGREHHRSLSNLPQQPCILSAPEGRLVLSWWGQEMNLWQISRANLVSDSLDHLSCDAANWHKKLVSKIKLQGEYSLSSVDLSADGSLLAAATISKIRMFRLKRKAIGLLKIHKIEASSNMATTGAKLLRISPDKRWLLIIKPDNEIHLHRITENGTTRGGVTLSEKSFHLSRIRRTAAEQNSIHSGLGNYVRSINRVSFSSNSKMLAVSDLSGYIDSWVLEGHEDLTQEANSAVNGSATIDSSDDGDSDPEQELHTTLVLGQRWIRNPAAELLPKLPAAPLILDFRPATATYSSSADRRTTIHSTRKNSHPQRHDLPKGEDRLFVMTSEHHIYEFEALSGRLSDWSRKNPATSLPSKFRENRERVMGAIWDVSGNKQRIWLYGSTWLWMFDFSKDLEPPADDSQIVEEKAVMGYSRARKRKRGADADSPHSSSERLRTRDSGAGSRILGAEINPGDGGRLRKIDGAWPDNSQLVNMSQEHAASESEEDDAEARAIPVKQSRAGTSASLDGKLSTKEEGPVHADTHPVTGASLDPPYWSTYMYRPILGIVPLNGRNMEGTNSIDQCYRQDQDEDSIEVALVERPMEDVDLPPRYHGSQDWHEET